ncbi:hypothetical protein [Streptomyces sp. NPDC050534]
MHPALIVVAFFRLPVAAGSTLVRTLLAPTGAVAARRTAHDGAP